MSNAFVTVKMCYVYNQWYDISCATLYFCRTCISCVMACLYSLMQWFAMGNPWIHFCNGYFESYYF